MDVALYDIDDGFFGRGHGAGRRGRDFVTAPRSGRCSGHASRARSTRGGATSARPIRSSWSKPAPARVTRPRDPAGRPGLLAGVALRAGRTVGGAPRAAARAPAARAGRRGARALRPPRRRRGARYQSPQRGPVFASAADLPELPRRSVVLANELLDNLRSGSLVRHGARLARGADRTRRDGSEFGEVLVPRPIRHAHALSSSSATRTSRWVPAADTDGRRRSWIGECSRAHSERDRRCCSTTSSSRRRARRGPADGCGPIAAHGRGRDALANPARQDITMDVFASGSNTPARRGPAFESSVDTTPSGVAAPASASTSWWPRAGARGTPARRAATSRRSPGRSRANEAAALTDPAGLGAHRGASRWRMCGRPSARPVASALDRAGSDTRGMRMADVTLEALLRGGAHVPTARPRRADALITDASTL